MALMNFDRLKDAEAVNFVQPSPAKIGDVTKPMTVFRPRRSAKSP